METYTLDWQKGQLIQDRMQEADYKRISDKKIDDTMKVQIMNLKEYEQIKEYIPHKKNLLYSMNHVRYCKVDSFHDCVQGIMRVPDLKNHEYENLILQVYSTRPKMSVSIKSRDFVIIIPNLIG